MKISKLRPEWGVVISETDISEVLNLGPDYWRDVGYKKDLVLFKGLGKITDAEYFKLCSYFGKPWSKRDYTYSKEVTHDLEYNNNRQTVTRFSNILSPRLGCVPMPWHADIPLRGNLSFPWRALYIVSNPSPDTGLTSFLNLKLDIIKPTPEELAYYNTIELTMQSWLREGEEIQRQPFIKTDPITGIKSLRANSFVIEGQPLLWIKNVHVNGKDAGNLETLGPILKKLSNRDDLMYTHKWDLHDFIIYNNWSFVHNRTEIILKNEADIREFLRANLDHVTKDQWEDYKKTI